MKCQSKKPSFIVACIQGNYAAAQVKKWLFIPDPIVNHPDLSCLINDIEALFIPRCGYNAYRGGHAVSYQLQVYSIRVIVKLGRRIFTIAALSEMEVLDSIFTIKQGHDFNIGNYPAADDPFLGIIGIRIH